MVDDETELVVFPKILLVFVLHSLDDLLLFEDPLDVVLDDDVNIGAKDY